jgi:hypothetical protein
LGVGAGAGMVCHQLWRREHFEKTLPFARIASLDFPP